MFIGTPLFKKPCVWLRIRRFYMYRGLINHHSTHNGLFKFNIPFDFPLKDFNLKFLSRLEMYIDWQNHSAVVNSLMKCTPDVNFVQKWNLTLFMICIKRHRNDWFYLNYSNLYTYDNSIRKKDHCYRIYYNGEYCPFVPCVYHTFEVTHKMLVPWVE